MWSCDEMDAHNYAMDNYFTINEENRTLFYCMQSATIVFYSGFLMGNFLIYYFICSTLVVKSDYFCDEKGKKKLSVNP